MRDGMRTTVQGILLVHQHNHPHVLLLKRNKTFSFILPGGSLRPGESGLEGLRRKLSSKLAAPVFEPDWQIGECVAVWWVTKLDTRMFYPICSPHITRPKECRKLFLVHLSAREYFQGPEGYELLAVPLFLLYDNPKVFGSVAASIPEIFSRFHISRM